MATPDEEQALLGILEASLGDRQRAMNGLHLDQVTSLEVHREMLELAQRTAEQPPEPAIDQTDVPPADRPSRQLSHRRPGPVSRWVLAARRRFTADAGAPDADPTAGTVDLRS